LTTPLVLDANVVVYACKSPSGFDVLGDAELVAPRLMWSVHGTRSDGKGFAVVYNSPADGDSGAARIISTWPVRKKKPRT